MTENEWTRSIADKLAPAIAPLMISTQQKIPYLQDIDRKLNDNLCGNDRALKLD